jgi:hypothetical protein
MRYDISGERVRGIEVEAFYIIFRAIRALWGPVTETVDPAPSMFRRILRMLESNPVNTEPSAPDWANITRQIEAVKTIIGGLRERVAELSCECNSRIRDCAVSVIAMERRLSPEWGARH